MKDNRARLNRKAMKRLEVYKGADRSVTVGSCIAPPCTKPFKTGFAASKPRLDTSIRIKSLGNVVHVPSKLGL